LLHHLSLPPPPSLTTPATRRDGEMIIHGQVFSEFSSHLTVTVTDVTRPPTIAVWPPHHGVSVYVLDPNQITMIFFFSFYQYSLLSVTVKIH
jgi:hypothetical protein